MQPQEHTYEWYKERLSCGRLTPDERADFQAMLDERLKAMKEAMQGHRDTSIEVSQAFKTTDPNFEEMKDKIVAKHMKEQQ